MFRTEGRVTGQLKVTVVRGFNLAIRDVRTSDPYVVVQHGRTKQKTRVIKKNVNPEWYEEMTFSSINPLEPVRVEVFDKDRFSNDDSMGDAAVDIRPLIEAGNVEPEDIPDDLVVKRVSPSTMNSLATESSVRWIDGKVVQHIILRLNNVECGELELHLQWTKY